MLPPVGGSNEPHKNESKVKSPIIIGKQRDNNVPEKTIATQQTSLPINEEARATRSDSLKKRFGSYKDLLGSKRDSLKKIALAFESIKTGESASPKNSPRVATPRSPGRMTFNPDSPLYKEAKEFLKDELKNLPKIGLEQWAQLEKDLIEGYCEVKTMTGKEFSEIKYNELPRKSIEAKLQMLENEISQLKKQQTANTMAIQTVEKKGDTENKLELLKAKQQNLESSARDKILLLKILISKKDPSEVSAPEIRQKIDEHIENMMDSARTVNKNIMLPANASEALFEGYCESYANWESYHSNESFNPENVHLFELPQSAQFIQYEMMSLHNENMLKNAGEESVEEPLAKFNAELLTVYNHEGYELEKLQFSLDLSKAKNEFGLSQNISSLHVALKNQLEHISEMDEESCLKMAIWQGYIALGTDGALVIRKTPQKEINSLKNESSIMAQWKNTGDLEQLKDLMKANLKVKQEVYLKRKMEIFTQSAVKELKKELQDVKENADKKMSFEESYELIKKIEILKIKTQDVNRNAKEEEVNQACSKCIKKLDEIEYKLLVKFLTSHKKSKLNGLQKQKFSYIRNLYCLQSNEDKEVSKINFKITQKEEKIVPYNTANFKVNYLINKMNWISDFENQYDNEEVVSKEIKKIGKNLEKLEDEINKLENDELKAQFESLKTQLSKYSHILDEEKGQEAITNLKNLSKTMHDDIQERINSRAFTNLGNIKSKLLEASNPELKLNKSMQQEYDILTGKIAKEIELLQEIEKFGIIKNEEMLQTKADNIYSLAKILGYNVQKLIMSKLPNYFEGKEEEISPSLSPRTPTDSLSNSPFSSELGSNPKM